MSYTGDAGGDVSSTEEQHEDERQRFLGADSSWRHHTEEERALAAALDQAESNDLSVHLYNSHAWKAQYRNLQLPANSKPWRGKQHWIKPDERGKTPFVPLAGWTTWPLRPEDVPRHREQFGVPSLDPSEETQTITKSDPWKPSLELEEELKAVTLRCAHEKFLSRRFSDHQTQNNRGKSPVASSPESGGDDNADDSQASDGKEGIHDDQYSAMFTADDDKASTIIEPTVRHIIQKFDNLLLGLHRSRQGHRRERSVSSSRGKSGISMSRSSSISRAPDRAATPGAKRKRVKSDAAEIGDSISSSFESSTERRSRATSRQPPRYNQHSLAPRDWSEVLGIAALVGWDQTVLDRAARRCAAIFGETMSFRTMPETSATNPCDEVVEYRPEPIPNSDLPSQNEAKISDIEEGDEERSRSALCCPHPDCTRYDQPYKMRWRLREHLKRGHDYTEEDIKVWDEQSEEHDEDSESGSSFDQNDISREEITSTAVRVDGFLQPVGVHISRGRDRGKRRQRARGTQMKRKKSTES